MEPKVLLQTILFLPVLLLSEPSCLCDSDFSLAAVTRQGAFPVCAQ